MAYRETVAAEIVTQTRVLDTVFQPNANRATFVTYTVAMSLATSGGSAVTVRLRCGPSATPGANPIRSEARLSQPAAATWAASANGVVSYVVPAGYYVELDSNVSAGASVILQYQSEVSL